ncbi:PD-(D/E)XK nuclease family protein [Candidatus Thioglobus sp.]|nr:PD-(D/E)XK nuclease family protein [Candidatus Thioglobus sp.]MDB3893764.1 PD-(D/E)XK nuclease family protein [Candidatus Thioglobus sp.]
MHLNADLTHIVPTDIIVVANNRQVLAFKRTFSKQHPLTQLPNILSWQQYLKHTWQSRHLNSTLRLIDPIEQRYLIESSLQQFEQNNHAQLTSEVIKNYDYCTNHLIPIETLAQSRVQICEVFASWIVLYQKTKNDLSLVDVNDLPGLILQNKGNLQAPYIYGFKTLTPLQQKVFDTLGHQVIGAQYTDKTEQKCFENSLSEIQAAAIWAKQQQDKNPDCSLVIVCPQLSELQYQLSSIFDQTFDDLLTQTGKKSYNISLGLPLSHYTLVQDLLNLLELNEQIKTNNIQTALFTQVVTSVYIQGYQLERSSRHMLVNQALSLSLEYFQLEQLEEAIIQCPVLSKLIQAAKLNDTKNQRLDEHLLNFNTALTNWGFTTDRPLSSSEYQLFNKYLSSSLKLNQLALHQNKCLVKTALYLLKEISNQIVFQAQSSKTNVQIIGSLEAEGLYFDKAWVMGMTHDFLPAKLNSPRFIATDIAIHHQIPHSSYELIQTDAQNTLNNLCSLSSHVIFSYAKSHLESEQLPSPLIDFNADSIMQPDIKPATREIELINDASVSQFTQSEVKSGVNLLKDQMACDFKGFAHRLNLTHYDEPHIGLDRREQGNAIHNALQYIYQEIDSKEALLKLSPAELETLIDQKVYAALKRHPNSGFKAIEKTRLTQLLHKFIETDKARENFRILATEQSVHVEISGLSFNTRLDRLDQMDNGDRIIFDYKTGDTSTSKWCSTDIVEPQLPIYSVTNNTQGAAFIELNSSAVSFKGLSKDPDSLPKQSSRKGSCQEWDEQINIWSKRLDQASQDFQSGQAQVLPNKTACDYCEFDLLCRIQK